MKKLLLVLVSLFLVNINIGAVDTKSLIAFLDIDLFHGSKNTLKTMVDIKSKEESPFMMYDGSDDNWKPKFRKMTDDEQKDLMETLARAEKGDRQVTGRDLSRPKELRNIRTNCPIVGNRLACSCPKFVCQETRSTSGAGVPLPSPLPAKSSTPCPSPAHRPQSFSLKIKN